MATSWSALGAGTAPIILAESDRSAVNIDIDCPSSALLKLFEPGDGDDNADTPAPVL
jgi:hypothetical protein